jgi:hypothetical protein
MRQHGLWLSRRADALQFRIKGLVSLRRLVNLSHEQDISERQWSVLEPQLSAASTQLISRVKSAVNHLLPQASDPEARRRLNAALARVELDMARAFTFFDTYMDVLTQRRSQELGAILAGCDVLALEAMRRDHPALALVEPPLVYCDRGFGASIVRESVPFPDGTPNPMPLIQIPYSRLREKCNLTSVLHEAGHQGLQRLGLVGPLANALRAALDRAAAPAPVRDLYGMWAFEVGPDFWAFCLSGVAEASAVRDLFAMQPTHAMRISLSDPHPPPYLRALLTFDWCRRAWGRGVWDDWERSWRALYPLEAAPPGTRQLLLQARRRIPLIGQTLFNQRFRQLGGRALPDLFDLPSVAPAEVARMARGARSGVLDLKGLKACTQLAVFSQVRDLHAMSEERLDRIMTQWLRRLGARRHTLH